MTELGLFKDFDLKIKGRGHCWDQNWGQFWLGNFNIYFYAKFYCPSFKNEGDITILVYQFGKIAVVAVVVAAAAGMLRT